MYVRRRLSSRVSNILNHKLSCVNEPYLSVYRLRVIQAKELAVSRRRNYQVLSLQRKS